MLLRIFFPGVATSGISGENAKHGEEKIFLLCA